MPVMDNTESLRAGVRADLRDTWKQEFPVFKSQQEKLLKFLPSTTIRDVSYPFKDAVPFPELWEYNMPRNYSVFKDRVIRMSKYNYSLAIPWNGFDADDDQLGDMQSHAQLGARRFLQLPDKMWPEYMNGTASLLPQLKSAYDGVSMFSAVDGSGNARFSATGGNILTGSGATVAGMAHDFMQAKIRAYSFRDPAGQIIFSPGDLEPENMFAIVPTALAEQARQLQKSENLKISDENLVSQSNHLVNVFNYQENPYLTDSSDWYVLIQHSMWKPFVYRAPEDVETFMADVTNSDRARENNIYAVYSHVRTDIGPYAPFTMIKINN